MKKNILYMVKWLETERGWGQRPDGFSLHKSREDCNDFIQEYWDGQPAKVPHEYSRPSSDPKPVVVSDDIYDKVEGNGIRVWQHQKKDFPITVL